MTNYVGNFSQILNTFRQRRVLVFINFVHSKKMPNHFSFSSMFYFTGVIITSFRRFFISSNVSMEVNSDHNMKVFRSTWSTPSLISKDKGLLSGAKDFGGVLLKCSKLQGTVLKWCFKKLQRAFEHLMKAFCLKWRGQIACWFIRCVMQRAVKP